jgi:alcohol dehydrogenase/propanol-preferring alcohol dehydrogenase
VVLVGAGGLGLNAIAILKALGHRRICIVDVAEAKLAAARAQGATETVLATDAGTAQRIIEACGGPVGGIIDLVNGSATSRFAFDSLRKGGKLVQVGLFGGEMQIPLPLMPIRALTIQGSYVGDVKELRALIGIAKAGKIPAIPVELTPQRNADAVLNRLRNGQITGRVVLVSDAA